MVRTQEALLVFGKAVDETTLTLPDDVYRCLDRAAELHEESAREGRDPLVIVSGFQRAWRVYGNDLLLDEHSNPLRECDPMANYLSEHHGIEAIREGKAGSIADNIARSKLLLKKKVRPIDTEQSEKSSKEPPVAISGAHIVTFEPSERRTLAIARKIFGNFCTVDVETIPTNMVFPMEAKFFGDHLCMLKEMEIGDESFIIKDDKSQWPRLGAEHNEKPCPYFKLDNESEPFTNNHPEDVMRELLAGL